MGPSRSVLVVEDEPKLAALLCDYLHAAGLQPLVAAEGPAALRAVAESELAAVLPDLNLPGLDGIEVCRQIRRKSAANRPCPY